LLSWRPNQSYSSIPPHDKDVAGTESEYGKINTIENAYSIAGNTPVHSNTSIEYSALHYPFGRWDCEIPHDALNTQVHNPFS
jgi:hypothetical protein